MVRNLVKNTAVVVSIVTAVGVTGCSAPTPAVPTPTVLTLGQIIGTLTTDPAVGWFVSEVAERSSGKLTIALARNCCGQSTTAGVTLVDRVGTGKIDLGWVATSGLEDAGVTGFRALSAPALIDSYAAQAAVLASDVPKQVLPSVENSEVTALSLEPGMMQRPIGNGVALVEPEAWNKIILWSSKSQDNAATIEALGARSSQVGDAARDAGLTAKTIDGAENSVFAQAKTVSVPNAVIPRNFAMRPRISVLLGNQRRLRELTNEQRGYLAAAAGAVSARSMDIAKIDEASAVKVCSDGGHFSIATPTQLDAYDAAFAGVYANLEADPLTNKVIAEIRALRPAAETRPNELTVPLDCYF